MPRPKGRNQISAKALTHEQVVVLALMLLGGESTPIDTEDVALKADEIAPGRFRWRKHSQYINNELVHTALRDAKRLGGLVRGAGSEGWQLTVAGLELVEQMKSHGIAGAESRRSIDPKERVWLSRERVRLLSDEAFLKYAEAGPNVLSRRDAEHFFRLDDYVTGEVRAARLQRIVNHFGNDPELGAAVRTLADLAK